MSVAPSPLITDILHNYITSLDDESRELLMKCVGCMINSDNSHAAWIMPNERTANIVMTGVALICPSMSMHIDVSPYVSDTDSDTSSDTDDDNSGGFLTRSVSSAAVSTSTNTIVSEATAVTLIAEWNPSEIPK